MSHSMECIAEFERRSTEVAVWRAAWPNHCKACGGAGATYSTYDPSPAGVSLSAGHMVDVDLCPDCAEKGICSRCGFQAWDPETEMWCPPCPHCGWDGKDCEPAEAECFCWMDEVESY